MAPPALVKLNEKHLLNQQGQDLASWGVSVYRETSYSPTSCGLNSSNSSSFKGNSLDLQLCKREENQTPKKMEERALSGFVDFLGKVRKYRQWCVGAFFAFFFPSKYLFTFYGFFYYWFSPIHLNILVPWAKNIPVFNIPRAGL